MSCFLEKVIFTQSNKEKFIILLPDFGFRFSFISAWDVTILSYFQHSFSILVKCIALNSCTNPMQDILSIHFVLNTEIFLCPWIIKVPRGLWEVLKWMDVEVLHPSQYVSYYIQYQFCICTDYRALGMTVRDLGAWIVVSLALPVRGKGVRKRGAGSAHQQLVMELVVLPGSWVLQPWDAVFCLGERIHLTKAGQKHLCQQDGWPCKEGFELGMMGRERVISSVVGKWLAGWMSKGPAVIWQTGITKSTKWGLSRVT